MLKIYCPNERCSKPIWAGLLYCPRCGKKISDRTRLVSESINSTSLLKYDDTVSLVDHNTLLVDCYGDLIIYDQQNDTFEYFELNKVTQKITKYRKKLNKDPSDSTKVIEIISHNGYLFIRTFKYLYYIPCPMISNSESLNIGEKLDIKVELGSGLQSIFEKNSLNTSITGTMICLGNYIVLLSNDKDNSSLMVYQIRNSTKIPWEIKTLDLVCHSVLDSNLSLIEKRDYSLFNSATHQVFSIVSQNEIYRCVFDLDNLKLTCKNIKLNIINQNINYLHPSTIQWSNDSFLIKANTSEGDGFYITWYSAMDKTTHVYSKNGVPKYIKNSGLEQFIVLIGGSFYDFDKSVGIIPKQPLLSEYGSLSNLSLRSSTNHAAIYTTSNALRLIWFNGKRIFNIEEINNLSIESAYSLYTTQNCAWILYKPNNREGLALTCVTGGLH